MAKVRSANPPEERDRPDAGEEGNPETHAFEM
jgi:hypothetical protein